MGVESLQIANYCHRLTPIPKVQKLGNLTCYDSNSMAEAANFPSGLVDAERCLEIVWPDPRCRPKLRWFLDRKRAGQDSVPEGWAFCLFRSAREVRRAIDRDCKVEACTA
jgi:hypothetical protein